MKQIVKNILYNKVGGVLYDWENNSGVKSTGASLTDIKTLHIPQIMKCAKYRCISFLHFSQLCSRAFYTTILIIYATNCLVEIFLVNALTFYKELAIKIVSSERSIISDLLD